MATARDAVLRAFDELEAQTERTAFRADEVWQHVAAATSDFQETTIRTYVTSAMCANAPVHHANHTDDVVRVKRGLYRRIQPSDDLAALRAQGDAQVKKAGSRPYATPPPDDARGDAHSEWHWEGNIQAAMVSHLVGAGWGINSVANTSTRERGVDIIATRDGMKLLVEVKGYPSEYYVSGDRKGQRKPTPPSLQARVWFADLLMSSMVNAGDEPDARILLCVPDVPTYRNLAGRVSLSLDRLNFTIAWVGENGEVRSESA